jgi:hypothetical protein
MTEQEFDLLDELYFVQHYNYLKDMLGWEDEEILTTLKGLYEKELIKCFQAPDKEIFSNPGILENGTMYYYLATKKGLMLHNAI